ncbi:hypothetical protein PoB_002625600 [Plakobranchus ocellatus]|uniref:Uncharacterized protein n=1 Tax=Plakobranchus ocellatus TaxID=259542 RepID=A0AAV3ZUY0_9GAST|nr:hypothetical protein PoB_002625600 [Plakobranchus ocellatus]
MPSLKFAFTSAFLLVNTPPPQHSFLNTPLPHHVLLNTPPQHTFLNMPLPHHAFLNTPLPHAFPLRCLFFSTPPLQHTSPPRASTSACILLNMPSTPDAFFSIMPPPKHIFS